MIDVKPQDYPAYGDRVTLTRYADGTAEAGDLASPDLVVTGTVIGTPRSGSSYLVVAADDQVSDPREYGKDDPTAGSINGNSVTLSVPALQHWTIEPVKPEAAVITAVVDLRDVDPDMVALVLRHALQGLGCAPLKHSYGPDADTVADCAGVESVKTIDLF